jgi:vacuolar-type H+-ATPase subunit E/Vma4
LDKEKEDLLSKKKRQEAFRLEMKRLQKKKELLSKAKEEAADQLSSLSAKEKKDIYLKNLKDKKKIIKESSQIVVPEGKKKELRAILKEAGIDKEPIEEKLSVKEGYLIKGGKWSLEITLEKILNKEVDRNKKEYVDTLFGSDN